MKLWLDDVRKPPKGWVWAINYDEAVSHLMTGEVVEISLDHDLGMEVIGNHKNILIGVESQTAKTGYDVACWIEEEVYEGRLTAPIMYCHSANPVGKGRINQVITKVNHYAGNNPLV